MYINYTIHNKYTAKHSSILFHLRQITIHGFRRKRLKEASINPESEIENMMTDSGAIKKAVMHALIKAAKAMVLVIAQFNAKGRITNTGIKQANV